jgi:hypothetical protein
MLNTFLLMRLYLPKQKQADIIMLLVISSAMVT